MIRYLTCKTKYCKGSAKMKNGILEPIGQHTHEPNELDETIEESLNELKAILINRAKTEVTKLKEIYEDEIMR